MRYYSVKNCVNNDVSGSEICHNRRKEWIEQVIWKTKHPIFICSEPKCKEKWIASKAFKTGAPTKPIDYLYLKFTCFKLG